MSKDRFTATDALAIDVEMVERWSKDVVADGDACTPLLVSLVTRLRASADYLADYLYRTSEPSQGAGAVARGCAPRAAPRRKRREAGAGP